MRCHKKSASIKINYLRFGCGCELNDEGYIKTDAYQKITVKGIFACGDNTTRVRTVANAVAMGTATGMMTNKELIEENF